MTVGILDVMDPDLLSTIDAQRGVVARFQVARQLDDDCADALMRSPRVEALDPPVRGVRRMRGSGVAPEQYAFAVALRGRPASTLTGPGVLGLLRVPGFTPADSFELLVQPGRRLRNVGLPVRSDPDPGRPVTTYGDVRVAAPIDALIDAAGFVEAVGARRLRVAWDHLRWEGIARTERLVSRIEELRGTAPGAAILARVLEDAGGLRAESEGERALAPVLDCFDPRPERQAWVRPGRRVDFYYRPVRMAWEYLGRADHTTVADRIADDERDAELRRDGIRVQYVTAGDVADPVALLGRVAGALTVRAHELGVTAPTVARPLPA